MQQIAAEVPLADALVVNPLHLAVALRYDREKMAAPRVTPAGCGSWPASTTFPSSATCPWPAPSSRSRWAGKSPASSTKPWRRCCSSPAGWGRKGWRTGGRPAVLTRTPRPALAQAA